MDSCFPFSSGSFMLKTRPRSRPPLWCIDTRSLYTTAFLVYIVTLCLVAVRAWGKREGGSARPPLEHWPCAFRLPRRVDLQAPACPDERRNAPWRDCCASRASTSKQGSDLLSVPVPLSTACSSCYTRRRRSTPARAHRRVPKPRSTRRTESLPRHTYLVTSST